LAQGFRSFLKAYVIIERLPDGQYVFANPIGIGNSFEIRLSAFEAYQARIFSSANLFKKSAGADKSLLCVTRTNELFIDLYGSAKN
jgi:hypothetical protein